MEIAEPGVQAQEFLSAFPPFESLLLSLLSPCGAMFLLDDVVAAGRRNHLLMVDLSQPRELPDGGPVTSELIRVNDFWKVKLAQQPDQEGLGSFGIPVALEQNVEHVPVLVDSPPAARRPQGRPFWPRTANVSPHGCSPPSRPDATVHPGGVHGGAVLPPTTGRI